MGMAGNSYDFDCLSDMGGLETWMIVENNVVVCSLRDWPVFCEFRLVLSLKQKSRFLGSKTPILPEQLTYGEFHEDLAALWAFRQALSVSRMHLWEGTSHKLVPSNLTG